MSNKTDGFEEWKEKDFKDNGYYDRDDYAEKAWNHLTEKHAQEKMIFLLTGAEYEREIQTLTQRVESAESCLRIYFDLGKGRNPDAIYKEHLEKYRSKE